MTKTVFGIKDIQDLIEIPGVIVYFSEGGRPRNPESYGFRITLAKSKLSSVKHLEKHHKVITKQCISTFMHFRKNTNFVFLSLIKNSA
jgi:hypothetical protein